MSVTLRRSQDRGHADRGWLDARFSFSFADYHDPAYMGFSVLRVLNEDVIAPGRGFGPHAHRDMEILTYMIGGRLRHRDSMGEERVLGPNEVQAMSAGTGIVHSEFNASETEPSHSIQIWIEPRSEDLVPAYQQIAFEPAEKTNRLRLLAGPETSGDPGVVRIHQDARVWVTQLEGGQTVTAVIGPGRQAWIQVLGGDLLVAGHRVSQGDGVAISGQRGVTIAGADHGEALVFDLP